MGVKGSFTDFRDGNPDLVFFPVAQSFCVTLNADALEIAANQINSNTTLIKICQVFTEVLTDVTDRDIR